MVHKTLNLRRGGAALRVAFSFDEPAHVEEFNSRMADCKKMEKLLNEKRTVAAAELYFKAIEALYTLVMGEDTAKAVIQYFGDDMLGMVSTINPIMSKEIDPAVQRASVRNREKARRKFLKDQKKRLRA